MAVDYHSQVTMDNRVFDRSRREQLAINAARTPTERFLALCDLLEAARAMAPNTPEARQRRLRLKAARQREREQFRVHCRRLLAAQPADASSGV